MMILAAGSKPLPAAAVAAAVSPRAGSHPEGAGVPGVRHYFQQTDR